MEYIHDGDCLPFNASDIVVNCGKGKPGPCADGESPVADDESAVDADDNKSILDKVKDFFFGDKNHQPLKGEELKEKLQEAKRRIADAKKEKTSKRDKNGETKNKGNISGIVAAIDNQDLTKEHTQKLLNRLNKEELKKVVKGIDVSHEQVRDKMSSILKKGDTSKVVQLLMKELSHPDRVGFRKPGEPINRPKPSSSDHISSYNDD